MLRRALAAAGADGVPAVVSLEPSVGAGLRATISMGRIRHADEVLGQAGELLARYPGLRRPVALDLAVARKAEVAADWADMAEAVDRVLSAGPVYRDNGIAATVAFVQATHLVAVGELPRAAALLRHNRALNTAAVGVLGTLRDRELADIEVRLGRPNAALRLLEPHQRPPVAVVVGVTAARAYLALGDLGQALACVRAVLTTPSSFVTRQLSVEAVLAEAEIADRRGDPGRATELLDRALVLADGDLALPFVRTAEVFGPLLARHPALAGRWPAPVSGPPAGSARDRRGARAAARPAHLAGAGGAAADGHRPVHRPARRRAAPVGEHGEIPPGRDIPQARGRRAPGGGVPGPGAGAALTRRSCRTDEVGGRAGRHAR